MAGKSQETGNILREILEISFQRRQNSFSRKKKEKKEFWYLYTLK